MSVRVFYDILNQKGTPAMYTDTFANRPAYGYQGRLFISTDSGQIFEDTGSAWTLVADAGVGSGTLSSVCLNGNTTATGIVITAGGLSSNSITNTENTAGSVLFAGASGLESQSNATFFWDNTNKRLGIGNASPGAPLDIHGTGTQIQVNGTGSSNSYIQFQNAGVNKWRIGNLYNAGANSFEIYDVLNATTRLTILNTGATTLNGALTSNSVAITGGTSAQFLKADGTTDSNTYLTTSSASSTYLPLVGGTLTGALSGTSFTGTSFVKSGGTSAQILAADGSVITAGTNITISGGTISTSGSGISGTGTSGQVAYFNGTSSITSSATFAFTPTSQLLVNNSVTAASAIARGTNLTSTLTAAANSDVLVGLDIAPTFTNGAFTGVSNYIFRALSGINSCFDITTSYTTLNRNLGTAQALRGFTVTPTAGTSASGAGAGNTSVMSVGDGTNFAVIGYNWSPTGAKTVFGGITAAGNQLPIALYGRDLEIYNGGTVGFKMFDATSNIVLQRGGTFTDAGFRLDVNGTARVQGIITASSRANFNGSTDNSLFSLNSGGTLYTGGFSPNAQASSLNTLTLTSAGTTWIYNGTGVATWTLFNPSGTNQMVWIKNAGTGIITLNAYSGTNIINNSGSSVSSITIAVGATALIQQDGNVKSYQLQ